MFAAVGSAVDSIQDAQQLQTPITIPIILAPVSYTHLDVYKRQPCG